MSYTQHLETFWKILATWKKVEAVRYCHTGRCTCKKATQLLLTASEWGSVSPRHLSPPHAVPGSWHAVAPLVAHADASHSEQWSRHSISFTTGKDRDTESSPPSLCQTLHIARLSPRSHQRRAIGGKAANASSAGRQRRAISAGCSLPFSCTSTISSKIMISSKPIIDISKWFSLNSLKRSTIIGEAVVVCTFL